MPSQLYLADNPPKPVEALLSVFGREAGALSRDKVAKVVDVLDVVRDGLTSQGWTVATGARAGSGISLPTDAGPDVRADAIHPGGFVLWIETGRSWNNFEFLRHLTEGIRSTPVSHLVIAVIEHYGDQKTYERCESFLSDLLTSDRMQWPFDSVTLIGF